MSNDTINGFASGVSRVSGFITMTAASLINIAAAIGMITQSVTATFSSAGRINFNGAFIITRNTPNAVTLLNVNLNA